MRRTIIWVAAMLLFAVMPIFPADSGKLFKWSLFSMWLSTGADVTTSLIADGRPGLHETAPLIGRQFRGRGVALEFGSRGIATAIELLLVRRHPKKLHPCFAVENFGLTAASSIAASKNATLFTRRPQ